MLRLDLDPAWVEDLLNLWAASDAAVTRSRLGWPQESPMFRRLGVVSSDVDDDTYSTAEVLAMRAAVERLQADNPVAWEALLGSFKPWTGLPATPDTLALVRAVSPTLAAWVDEILEGK